MGRSMVMVMLGMMCVFPALIRAYYVGNPFYVQGCVYCDTCRCGFETYATKYISGARVRIECVDRVSLALKYTIEDLTDSYGNYNITVIGDRGDQMCDVVLVSSPQTDCATADPGRNRARVILTRYNGCIDDHRHANSMGFLRKKPLPDCAQVLQKYQEAEEY